VEGGVIYDPDALRKKNGEIPQSRRYANHGINERIPMAAEPRTSSVGFTLY
jgi:hypothetical protein